MLCLETTNVTSEEALAPLPLGFIYLSDLGKGLNQAEELQGKVISTIHSHGLENTHFLATCYFLRHASRGGKRPRHLTYGFDFPCNQPYSRLSLAITSYTLLLSPQFYLSFPPTFSIFFC